MGDTEKRANELAEQIEREALETPEAILAGYKGESKERINALFPESLIEDLIDRAFDERRTKTEILILSLIEYLKGPVRVKPKPRRRRKAGRAGGEG